MAMGYESILLILGKPAVIRRFFISCYGVRERAM